MLLSLRDNHRFLNYLTEGNIDEFTKILKAFLSESASLFDVKGKHSEKFYHGFVLGLIVALQKTHWIKSNRESGYGRYDVMIIPKDFNQLGIVLEFKTVMSDENSLEESAQEALEQINKRQYERELKQPGIANILKMGLAFREKEMSVAYQLRG